MTTTSQANAIAQAPRARRGRVGTRHLAAAIATLFLGAAGLAGADELGFKGGMIDALGGKFIATQVPKQQLNVFTAARPGQNTLARLKYWNQMAIDCMRVDHTPVAAGETRVFGEQFGPARSSRAMAIVQIAVFDAVDAVVGGYQSYAYHHHAGASTSLDAAIAQAAHDTLVALYPSQRAQIDAQLADDLGDLANDNRKLKGVELGAASAAAILTLRADDGSNVAEPRVGSEYQPSQEPGKWRPDPISQVPLAVGAYWGRVKPFVLRTGAQFRIPAPPALTSPQYTAAYQLSKDLGDSDSRNARTPEQTIIGNFWAYDGTPGIGAPPRLYNQVTWAVAHVSGTDQDLIKMARLMALANVAQADAGIAAWDSKYYYNYWRPVLGVRESDQGTGPTGKGDDNPDTVGDPNFVPQGAPADNVIGPNFTPPFPSYPSGHATLGGALFGTLRNFYGKDALQFTVVSDEYNGTTLDNQGNVRPLLPRSYTSFSQAEEENGISRIYLGVHWLFDKTEGVRLGRRVADYVYQNAFLPTH